ncbi:inositol monophosphatase family protein [Streptomyces sp. NPDC002623]
MPSPPIPIPPIPPFPEFGHAVGRALDECRAVVADFRRAPTAPRLKNNVFGGVEPVCDLDLRLQRLLIDAARERRPDLPVVAEEERGTLEPTPDRCLLIDPLDGTAPFLAGSDSYAIGVCLVDGGRPVASVLDLPAYRVRLTAVAGALHVDGDVDVLPWFGPRCVLTGPRHVGRVREALARHRLDGYEVRPVPTAGVKLALVALARAGAGVLPPRAGIAAPWDHAPGAVAVVAAGGGFRTATDDDGTAVRPAVLDAWLATAAGADAPRRLGRLLSPPPTRKAGT